MISGYCGQKLTWEVEAREIPLKSLMGSRKWDTFVSN